MDGHTNYIHHKNVYVCVCAYRYMESTCGIPNMVYNSEESVSSYLV